jgi:hypothetical protein
VPSITCIDSARRVQLTIPILSGQAVWAERGKLVSNRIALGLLSKEGHYPSYRIKLSSTSCVEICPRSCGGTRWWESSRKQLNVKHNLIVTSLENAEY